jgi:spoIIIJ-associated protein
MPWITKEGRTVEEAQEAAVNAAGLPWDALEIEVVSEGAKGLFGLGGEPAVVRVRPRSEAADVRAAFQDDITPVPTRRDDESGPVQSDIEPTLAPPGEVETPSDTGADTGADVAPEEKLPLSEQQEQAAQIGAEIVRGIIERMGLSGDINTRVAGGTVYVEVFGEDMGILIGRGGATLEALQEIVRAGVQRRLHTRQALVVDVEAYWERRRSRGGRGDRGERERRDDGNRRPRGNRRGGGNRRNEGNA